MLVSFFTSTEPLIGADYSSHPDCIYSEDIDFNMETKIPVLIGDNGEYSIEIQDKPLPPESKKEKRERVKSAFLLANDEEVSTELFEGEVFEGQELGDMLNQKLCSGNIYKEMQMHRELLDMFLPFLLESFGERLTPEQIGILNQIQSLGTRVKTLLSHF